jgi:hypothetical protein
MPLVCLFVISRDLHLAFSVGVVARVQWISRSRSISPPAVSSCSRSIWGLDSVPDFAFARAFRSCRASLAQISSAAKYFL